MSTLKSLTKKELMAQYGSKVTGLNEKMLKADMIAAIEKATPSEPAPEKKSVQGRNEY